MSPAPDRTRAGLPPDNQRSAALRARARADGGDDTVHILDRPGPPLSDRELEMVRGAYRVMARVGAQQLSLRQVAKEVGVSAALFIYHFGSKDNLLLETMRWALAGTVRRIEERLAGIDDPRRALKALLDAVFVDANANRDFHLIYLDLVQYAVRNPSFGGLTELLREHINGSYAFVIRMGVRAGTFQATDVELAAARSRALIEGRFIQWLQEPDWQQTYGSLRQEAYTELLNLLDG